jgi:hypothetical protein
MAGLDLTFLNSTTRDHFLPTLKDNIYNKMPLFNRLAAKGRMKTATGTSLSWRVVAKRHAATGLFTGYDILASQPTNPLVSASLTDAEYYATVAISGTEERRNTGNMEKLLDMVRVEMDNAEETLREDLTNGIYGAGAQIGGRNTINGLQLVITGSTGTYAGIDRSNAANAFWRSNLDSTTHTVSNLENPASTEYFGSLLRKQYLNASHKTTPDLIMTTKIIYGYYQDIAEAQHLRTNNELSDLGFDNVKFQNVDMMFDDYCPAGYLFMLNVGSFQFFAYPGANLDLQEEGWLKPVNQDAKISHILFQGQLRCDEPRANAAFSALPTT